MADKLQSAPYGPLEIEVYVACQALKQPIPRAARKRLQRAGLVTSSGEVSRQGWSMIGRLRWLRKEGKVDPKPEAPTNLVVPYAPRPKAYPGIGPRHERMWRKKAERINRKRMQRVLASVPVIQTKPSEEHVFKSAY